MPSFLDSIKIPVLLTIKFASAIKKLEKRKKNSKHIKYIRPQVTNRISTCNLSNTVFFSDFVLSDASNNLLYMYM